MSHSGGPAAGMSKLIMKRSLPRSRRGRLGGGGTEAGAGRGGKCAGRRVAQEHGGRRPLPAAPGGRTNGLALPRKNGLVLDQQIVEFALLHTFDQGGDLGTRVDEGGAAGVA
jgi:hypothetical protein